MIRLTKCELLINLVTCDRLKMLISLSQNGKRVVIDVICIYNAVNIPVGKEAEPKSFIIIIIGKLGNLVK